LVVMFWLLGEVLEMRAPWPVESNTPGRRNGVIPRVRPLRDAPAPRLMAACRTLQPDASIPDVHQKLVATAQHAHR
jgi:hypothetical protein